MTPREAKPVSREAIGATRFFYPELTKGGDASRLEESEMIGFRFRGDQTAAAGFHDLPSEVRLLEDLFIRFFESVNSIEGFSRHHESVRIVGRRKDRDRIGGDQSLEFVGRQIRPVVFGLRGPAVEVAAK